MMPKRQHMEQTTEGTTLYRPATSSQLLSQSGLDSCSGSITMVSRVVAMVNRKRERTGQDGEQQQRRLMEEQRWLGWR